VDTLNKRLLERPAGNMRDWYRVCDASYDVREACHDRAPRKREAMGDVPPLRVDEALHRQAAPASG